MRQNETVDSDHRAVVERGAEALVRDGTILRADVYRPDAPGPLPHHRGANALRQVRLQRPRPEAGGARLRLRHTGRARPLRLRRRVPTGLLQRGPHGRRGRLRYGRVGRRAAVVERPRRDRRELLRRLDADGAGPHPTSAPGCDDAPGDRGQSARPRDERRAAPRQGAMVERRHTVARPEAAQGRPLGAAHGRPSREALDGA